jgi:translation initiation factor IF-2
VNDGKILRGALARLLRDHAVVHEGRIGSLRRFKDDVREVAAGYECGIGLEGFNDLKPGDVIEVYEVEQVARRITPQTGRGAGQAPAERMA